MNQSILPDLDTRRLRLRPRCRADIPALLTLHADSEVMRYVGGPCLDVVAHTAELIARIDRDYGPGIGYWSLFPAAAPAHFLGWAALIPLEGRGPELEIGWRLSRAEWGQGYASEAAVGLLRYGLETLMLEGIIAVIDPDNHRSAQVAVRSGMQAAGQRLAYESLCDVFVAERGSWRGC